MLSSGLGSVRCLGMATNSQYAIANIRKIRRRRRDPGSGVVPSASGRRRRGRDSSQWSAVLLGGFRHDPHNHSGAHQHHCRRWVVLCKDSRTRRGRRRGSGQCAGRSARCAVTKVTNKADDRSYDRVTASYEVTSKLLFGSIYGDRSYGRKYDRSYQVTRSY